MKLRKKILGITMAGVILATGVGFAEGGLSAMVSDIRLFLNGTRIDKEIININGTSYLPLRAISESLELDVDWNGKSKRIDLKPIQKENLSVENDLLDILSEKNKTLETENETLKELLKKNNIQIPKEAGTIAYLNSEGLEYLSKEGSYWIDVITGYDVADSRHKDFLGNKHRNYLIVHTSKTSGVRSSGTVNYALQGQYDTFKATVYPYNEKKVNFNRELVIFIDGTEVFRKTITDKTMPEDISIPVKGGKIISFKCDVEDASRGGFLLANPRFESN